VDCVQGCDVAGCKFKDVMMSNSIPMCVDIKSVLNTTKCCRSLFLVM
jgi:hypothetical protein